MSKARAANPPPGQCRQCWWEAEHPDAHNHLRPGEDCQRCISCAANNHRGHIVKKPSIWI